MRDFTAWPTWARVLVGAPVIVVLFLFVLVAYVIALVVDGPQSDEEWRAELARGERDASLAALRDALRAR